MTCRSLFARWTCTTPTLQIVTTSAVASPTDRLRAYAVALLLAASLAGGAGWGTSHAFAHERDAYARCVVAAEPGSAVAGCDGFRTRTPPVQPNTIIFFAALALAFALAAGVVGARLAMEQRRTAVRSARGHQGLRRDQHNGLINVRLP